MNENLKEMLSELIDNGEETMIMFVRGRLENLGRMPAANFTYTENGIARFSGNIKAEVTVTPPSGETFTISKNMPLIAWNEVAESLMGVQQGDYLAIIGEYNTRKGQDGKYYPEMRIIYAEQY